MLFLLADCTCLSPAFSSEQHTSIIQCQMHFDLFLAEDYMLILTFFLPLFICSVTEPDLRSTTSVTVHANFLWSFLITSNKTQQKNLTSEMFRVQETRGLCHNEKTR